MTTEFTHLVTKSPVSRLKGLVHVLNMSSCQSKHKPYLGITPAPVCLSDGKRTRGINVHPDDNPEKTHSAYSLYYLISKIRPITALCRHVATPNNQVTDALTLTLTVFMKNHYI